MKTQFYLVLKEEIINDKTVCWSDNEEWWDKNTSETKVMSGNENSHYKLFDSIIEYKEENKKMKLLSKLKCRIYGHDYDFELSDWNDWVTHDYIQTCKR